MYTRLQAIVPSRDGQEQSFKRHTNSTCSSNVCCINEPRGLRTVKYSCSLKCLNQGTFRSCYRSENLICPGDNFRMSNAGNCGKRRSQSATPDQTRPGHSMQFCASRDPEGRVHRQGQRGSGLTRRSVEGFSSTVIVVPHLGK
jgi:hypothetical protein